MRATAPKKPKAGKDVVYIDHDDEITSIIEKVEAAKQKVVALVLPKRFTTLQSVVNMRLLKRSADSAGKNVVLITSESALLPLAGATGLHVAKNLQSKPEVPPSPLAEEADELPDEPTDPDEEIADKDAKLDHHRSVGELAAIHTLADESEAIPLGGENEEGATSAGAKPPKSSKDKKLKVPNFDRFRLLIGAGIVGLIALIVFLVLATTVLPKAVVAIRTTSTPVSADLRLTASDKIEKLDEAKLEIPAELKKSDQTSAQQVQATGQKNQGEKATGAVTISNCKKDNTAATVPAGTGVITNGLSFITQSAITLGTANFDGGGNCKSSGDHVKNVNVTAQQAGTKYNLTSGQNFSVSGQGALVTGKNSSAFSGGTDNILTIVSQADLDNAKKKITAADSDKFSKDFEKKLSDEGFFVLASTLKLGDAVAISSPAVGEQATNVSVTIKINHSVLVVPKDDLKKVVRAALSKEIDKTKQELGDEDVLEKADIAIVNQTSPSSVGLDITVETTAIPIIDKESLKKQIAGKKESEIKKIISTWPGVQNVEVKMSPFWVSKAPKKPAKITIQLEQAKTSQN